MPQGTGVDYLPSGWAFSHNVYHYEVSRVQCGKFYFPLMHHLMDNYRRHEAGLEGAVVHSETALMNISGGKVHLKKKKSGKELFVY